MTEKINVLGVDIDVTSSEAVLRNFVKFVRSGDTHSIYIVNAHTLNLAWSDRSYRNVLNSADLVLNDGSGVSLAARLQKKAFLENLAGTDLVPKMLEVACANGFTVYLLGGLPGTAKDAAAKLKRTFPGIKIVGTHHGYLDEIKDAQIVQLIKEADPDLLIVGMGNPLQEKWIYDHLETLGVPVAMGVGGLFKYYSGIIRRAPHWMRRFGLEWIYLLMITPRRSLKRYLIGNPQFIWRILAVRFRSELT